VTPRLHDAADVPAEVVLIARFTVEGEPASKARARTVRVGNKVRTYTPGKTRTAEAEIAWRFRAAAGGYRLDPDAAYKVVALFSSGTQQRRDVDNMLKLVLDGLNGVAWPDDAQVLEVIGRKSNGPVEQPQTEVEVYRIGTVYRPTGTCEHCGTEYRTYASWAGSRRFCSQACGYEHKRQRRQRTCAECGRTFEGVTVEKPARFCSKACSDANKRATVQCTGCGTTFTKQRCHVRASNFCTTKCREDYWREHRKAAAKGTCETCGGPTTKRTYRQCRPCRLRDAGEQGRPLPIAGAS